MSILFDFDGVLANTLERILRHSREASRIIGFPCEPNKEHVLFLEKMEFSHVGEQIGVPEGKIEVFVDTVLSLFQQDQEPLPIFEGIDKLVMSLSKRAQLGIVTSNSQRVVERFISEYCLSEHFQLILGLEKNLSKAEKLLCASEHFKCKPQSIYFVGDAKSDVLAARKAGAVSIAVSWGNQAEELLISSAPDFLVRSPQELLDVLKAAV